MNNIGEIVKGRVIGVEQDNNQPSSLIFKCFPPHNSLGTGNIPISELPETFERSGQDVIRQTGRRYNGRVMIAKVVQENPLILSNIEARKERSEKLLPELKEGQTIDVRIISARLREAEVEYRDCITMTLPADEYSLMPNVDLREKLVLGNFLKVDIISIGEDGKITCSHKKYAENPWPRLQKTYHKKCQYLSQVIKVLEKGILVSLEPGVNLFISPFPFFEVHQGDEVNVEITDINPEACKIKGYITGRAHVAALVGGR